MLGVDKRIRIWYTIIMARESKIKNTEGGRMKKKEIKVKTTVRDVTDLAGGVEVNVVIAKGGGTKGKWTIGWSFLVGGIVMIYEDGQIISARTPGLFETMTKFRDN